MQQNEAKNLLKEVYRSFNRKASLNLHVIMKLRISYKFKGCPTVGNKTVFDG